jgi:hypothetical protein
VAVVVRGAAVAQLFEVALGGRSGGGRLLLRRLSRLRLPDPVVESRGDPEVVKVWEVDFEEILEL